MENRVKFVIEVFKVLGVFILVAAVFVNMFCDLGYHGKLESSVADLRQENRDIKNALNMLSVSTNILFQIDYPVTNRAESTLIGAKPVGVNFLPYDYWATCRADTVVGNLP